MSNTVLTPGHVTESGFELIKGGRVVIAKQAETVPLMLANYRPSQTVKLTPENSERKRSVPLHWPYQNMNANVRKTVPIIPRRIRND